MGSLKLELQDVQKLMSDQGVVTRAEAVEIILGLEDRGFEAVYVGTPAHGYAPYTLMKIPKLSVYAAPDIDQLMLCQWTAPKHMMDEYCAGQLEHLRNWNWSTV